MDMQTAAPSNFCRSAPASSPWNDDAIVDTLKALYRDGLSASQIAKRMPVDMTRNAVIGKIHRLGLVSTGKAVRQKTNMTVRQARKVEAARKQALRRRELREKARHLLTLAPDFDGQPLPLNQPYANSLNLTFADLTKYSCRWIDGDPREGAGFCGHERIKVGKHLSAYCQHHHKLSVNDLKVKGPIPQSNVSRLGIGAINVVAEWTAPIEQRIREPA